MKIWLIKGSERHHAVILGPDRYVRDLDKNIGNSERLWLAHGWEIEPRD